MTTCSCVSPRYLPKEEYGKGTGAYQILDCQSFNRVPAGIRLIDGPLRPLYRLLDVVFVDQLAVRRGPGGLGIRDGLGPVSCFSCSWRGVWLMEGQRTWFDVQSANGPNSFAKSTSMVSQSRRVRAQSSDRRVAIF